MKKHTVSQQQSIGDIAENIAASHLEKQGLSLKTRNFSCRGGEIDLIMTDADQLVFIEVRYRSYSNFGSPLESITVQKQRRIIKAARHYLHQQGLTEVASCRFDAISIEPASTQSQSQQQQKPPNKTLKQPFTIEQYTIQWIKNAFNNYA